MDFFSSWFMTAFALSDSNKWKSSPTWLTLSVLFMIDPHALRVQLLSKNHWGFTRARF